MAKLLCVCRGDWDILNSMIHSTQHGSSSGKYPSFVKKDGEQDAHFVARMAISFGMLLIGGTTYQRKYITR